MMKKKVLLYFPPPPGLVSFYFQFKNLLSFSLFTFLFFYFFPVFLCAPFAFFHTYLQRSSPDDVELKQTQGISLIFQFVLQQSLSSMLYICYLLWYYYFVFLVSLPLHIIALPCCSISMHFSLSLLPISFKLQ